MTIIEDPHGVLSQSDRESIEEWATARRATDRKKTSLNMSPGTHGSLKSLAELHNNSMSSELEELVVLGWLVEKAKEPTRDVISRIVEERMAIDELHNSES